MSKVILELTDAELSVVYDALEEVRLSGGWLYEEDAELASEIQNKIFNLSKEQ